MDYFLVSVLAACGLLAASEGNSFAASMCIINLLTLWVVDLQNQEIKAKDKIIKTLSEAVLCSGKENI